MYEAFSRLLHVPSSEDKAQVKRRESRVRNRSRPWLAPLPPEEVIPSRPDLNPGPDQGTPFARPSGKQRSQSPCSKVTKNSKGATAEPEPQVQSF